MDLAERYVVGPDNHRGYLLVVVSIVFVTIAVSLVALRLTLRLRAHSSAGADDWAIMISVLMSIILTGLYVNEAKHGWGLHKVDVPQDDLLQAMKSFYVAQILYKATITCTKVSILLLYRRIFAIDKFLRLVWIVMGVVVVYGVVSILATIFQCQPLRKAYEAKVQGHCINLVASWYATAAFTMITDFLILIMPMPLIRSLKLPRAQRIGLMVVFALGGFVCIITIIRITTLVPTANPDTTYEQAVSNSWTDIEVNVGIICACMPALKQPLTKLFPRIFHPTQHTANYTAVQYSGTHHSHLQMPGNAHRGSFSADKALGPQDGGRDIILQRVDRAMAITKVTDVDVHFDESNSLESKGPTHYSAIYNDRLFIDRDIRAG